LTEPFPAFRIAGTTCSKGLASYLITSSQGHILINSDSEPTYDSQKCGVADLPATLRFYNQSCTGTINGSDLIKRLTGAKYMVTADVSVVEQAAN
jgi:metallo-beta-lactamase class B